MSLKDNDWWLPFISRLQEEPLSELCLEFGLVEEAVIPELVAEEEGRAVHETMWWPEVLRRIEAGDAIRDVARRFGTHTRRIRKGIARSGVSLPSTPAESEAPAADPLPPAADEPIAVIQRPSGRAARSAEPRKPRANSRLPRLGEDPAPAPADSRRRRRGRLRLVRPDAVDEAPAEAEAPRRAPRKPKTSPHSEVRVIAADEVDLSELIAEVKTEPPAAPVKAVPAAEAPEVSAPEVQAPAAEAAPISAPPAVEEAPAVAAPIAVPSITAPAAEIIPITAPAPASASRGSLTGSMAWRVRVDGVEQPMVVVADDILQATSLFADQLSVDQLRRADIYSAPLL